MAWSVVWAVVGAVAGGMFVWALLSHEPGDLAWLKSLLNLVPAAFVGFVVATAIAALAAWWWLNRFVGPARGTLEQVVSDAAAATRAAAENNASAAAAHAESAFREAAAWYGPIAARRFVVQTSVTVLVTFGGLVGTGLLFRQTLLLGEQNLKLQEQTALMRDQNAKLDLQTVTAEAQRRAGLAAELFSILQAVSQLMQPGEAGERGTEAPRLPTRLAARVVAFSRAATHYWTAEVPDRTHDGKAPVPGFAARPRNPERGQLLVGLVTAGVDLSTLGGTGATFASADLRDTLLSKALLGDGLTRGADLRGADLRGANLGGALLHDADLRDAVLANALLGDAELIGADLRGANLACADLFGADLFGAQFGVHATRVTSSHTNLRGADLRGADLRYANLLADLTGANLLNADLSSADFTGAVLTGAVVGSRSNSSPGLLPKGFAKGRSAAPAGWELFVEQDTIRLRPVGAPPAEVPLPPCR